MFEGLERIGSIILEEGAKEAKRILDDKLTQIIDSSKESRVKRPIYFFDSEDDKLIDQVEHDYYIDNSNE